MDKRFEVPTSLLISFLLEKGFTRRVSDPFSSTYVRGKIVVAFDPESPTYDTRHLKEDMDRQMVLEQSMEDKFFSDLEKFIQQHG